ncbi:TonB-dependent receptor domain-containing protein [Oceanicoccus sagamiensis]|uniref:Secretin/TonB short N-terminal domain-containing protein n=1 Tax=Oceanicoccus sagamiensis TaxID=716816 RepID=A0A1X9N9G4_9GAMM|nr:TonB-dependent receptor [Oceanicoccus sagamiensis]ARN73821.1 hypothetical protein BST96_06655 [Oceanicoccus sagamiensis]
MKGKASRWWMIVFVVLLPLTVTPLYADNDQGHGAEKNARRYTLSIRSQTVEQSLRSLASVSSKQLLFPYDQIETRATITLVGRYTLHEALAIILDGTDLSGELTSEGVILITPRQKSSDFERGDNAMNSKKKLLAATVGFLMGAGGSSVLAQDMADKQEEKAWVLEEILVTATKREQDLADVPISIVALSGETIDSRGMQTVSDLSLAVPNLSVTSAGGGNRFYYMRGVGNGNGVAPLVGTYFDEVPVSVTGAQPDIRTIDLERVEVLRGPQGTLFGQGSVGGTIRFITKNPEFNNISGHFGLSTYNTKKGDWSEEVTGVLNIPVIDDTLAFRIATSYENKSGWIDQIDKSDVILAEDINSSEGSNTRIKGLWQVTDKMRVSAMVVRHRNKSGGPNFVLHSADGRFTAEDGVMRSAADPNMPFGYDDEHDIFNITATYDFGYSVLTAIASKVDTYNLSDNETIFLTVPDGGVLEVARIGVVDETEIVSQEIRLSSAADEATTLEWTVGVFLADSELKNQHANVFRDFSIFGLGVLEGGPKLPEINSSDTIALFGDVSYGINDKWTVGMGSRVFRDDRSILTMDDGLMLEEEFDNVSSKVYLSFAATDNANIHFSVSEGFRSGGFNPPSDSAAGAPPSYEPEELLTYELGTKASWLNNTFITEVAFYYSEFTNFQGAVLDPSTSLTAFKNSGEAEIKGFEWDLRWAMNENITFMLNGNFTDGEFTSIPQGTVQQKRVGSSLDNIPEYSYTLAADYQYDWFDSARGFVRVDYNTQGPNTVTVHNAGIIPEVGESKVLTILNGHVGVNWTSFSIELFGNNLLDEDDGLSNWAFVGRETQYRRRSYGVKFDYDF